MVELSVLAALGAVVGLITFILRLVVSGLAGMSGALQSSGDDGWSDE